MSNHKPKFDPDNVLIDLDLPPYRPKLVAIQHGCPKVNIAGREWMTWLDIGETCPVCNEVMKDE